ncbi:hypothetical protein IEQ34_020045 [Dendrobium chrysotoxum]|uniref:Uncharacterized protein n=1 Tax=Dendrobium chrysotoxum TaxID=161865 RepID=A0AAV7G8J3_DENCH|nr:hypothetical protein IEQ34_020045 [Dendrobium chrysotoxum]
MTAKQKAKFCDHSGESRVNTEHSFDSGTTELDRMSNLSFCKGGRSASLPFSTSNAHYGVGNQKKDWSNSNKKLPSNRGKKKSKNKQTAGTEKEKGVKHAEAEDKELKLKKVLSSKKSSVKDLVKDYNHVKNTDKKKLR